MGEREAKDDTSTQTEQAGTVTKELKNRCPKNILWVSLFFARFIIYEGGRGEHRRFVTSGRTSISKRCVERRNACPPRDTKKLCARDKAKSVESPRMKHES